MPDRRRCRHRLRPAGAVRGRSLGGRLRPAVARRPLCARGAVDRPAGAAALRPARTGRIRAFGLVPHRRRPVWPGRGALAVAEDLRCRQHRQGRHRRDPGARGRDLRADRPKLAGLRAFGGHGRTGQGPDDGAGRGRHARARSASPTSSARMATASPMPRVKVPSASPTSSARMATASPMPRARVSSASPTSSARMATASPTLRVKAPSASLMPAARMATASPM
jgi:hypothetical protein